MLVLGFAYYKAPVMLVVIVTTSLDTSLTRSLVHQHHLLDPCSTGEAGMPLAVSPPIAKGSHSGEEPEEGTCQVDPNCVLHPLDVAVALGILMNEHL